MLCHQRIIFGVVNLLILFNQVNSIDLCVNTNPKSPRARLISPNPNVLEGLKKFSICLYLYFEDYEVDEMSLVSYSSADAYEPNELLLVVRPGQYTALYVEADPVVFKAYPNGSEWTHLCVSWRKGRAATLYLDGVLVGKKRARRITRPIGGKGKLILGQDQDDLIDIEYGLDDGLKGKMTQLHFWNKVISEDEVNSAMKCELKGNLINWITSEWVYTDNLIIQPSTDTCEERCGGDDDYKDENSCTKVVSSTYDLQEGDSKLSGKKQLVTAKLITPEELPSMKSFGVCFSVYHGMGSSDIEALMLQANDGPIFQYRPQAAGSNCITFNGDEVSVKCKMPDEGNATWMHHCFTWVSVTGTFKQYVDGQLVDKTDQVQPGYIIPVSKLLVRQIQTGPLKASAPTDGFDCKITDINIWQTEISADDVAQIADCSGAIPGDCLNWYDAVWEVSDVLEAS